MIGARAFLSGFRIAAGLGLQALCLAGPADAQTGQNEQAAGVALGRRVEGSTNGAAPAGDLRVSSRLQTRVETRLQTRIERFSPERADARFAYRMPTDDGSRRRVANTSQQSALVIPAEPLQSILEPKTEEKKQ